MSLDSGVKSHDALDSSTEIVRAPPRDERQLLGASTSQGKLEQDQLHEDFDMNW